METTSSFMTYYDHYTSLKERFKQRFRVQSAVIMRAKHRKKVAANAASMATTIAFARVFKGNVIVARLASKFAKDAKDQWRKRASSAFSTNLTPPSSKLLPSIPTVGNIVAAGAATSTAVAFSVDPAQAEAAIIQQGDLLSSTGQSGMELRAMPAPEVAGKKKKRNQEVEIQLVEKLAGQEDSPLMKAMQSVAVPLLANMCHVFMHGLNRVEVYGAEKLRQAVQERPAGQPLITVCNHVASMDDPLVLAAILPQQLLMDARAMRWTLCATDRCFTNSAAATFFTSVKVLPLIRGAGINQKGVDTAVTKLKRGEWVHIFPEGSRSRDGGKTLASIKRGIGRLVLDAGQLPLLVPFIHTGMQNVMPVGQKLPATGSTVSVIVGDPIPLDDLVAEHHNSQRPQSELYDKIAARVSQHMQALKTDLDSRVAHRQLAEAEARLLVPEMMPSLLGLVDREMDAAGLGAVWGDETIGLELGLLKKLREIGAEEKSFAQTPSPVTEAEAHTSQQLPDQHVEKGSDATCHEIVGASVSFNRAVVEGSGRDVLRRERVVEDDVESVSGSDHEGRFGRMSSGEERVDVAAGDEFLDDWDEDELMSRRWGRGRGFGLGSWNEWKEGMRDVGFAAQGLWRSGGVLKREGGGGGSAAKFEGWRGTAEDRLWGDWSREMGGESSEAPVKWGRTKAALAALRRDLWGEGWSVNVNVLRRGNGCQE